MIARYQWKLCKSALVPGMGQFSVLLIDWNDNVIIAENVVSLRPGFHGIVIDSISPFCVHRKLFEELRSEEVDPVGWHFELIIQVSSKSQRGVTCSGTVHLQQVKIDQIIIEHFFFI